MSWMCDDKQMTGRVAMKVNRRSLILSGFAAWGASSLPANGGSGPNAVPAEKLTSTVTKIAVTDRLGTEHILIEYSGTGRFPDADTPFRTSTLVDPDYEKQLSSLNTLIAFK